jgi:hypothetical protein
MQIVTRVTSAVQRVFGTIAEELGRQCQLIQRQRVFTASSLAKTLVFGFLHNPRASWKELAEVAAACGASVSPQAIEQRFTPKLVSFLFRLCEAMTSQVVAAEPAVIPLLQRFHGVFLHDSTAIQLPDEYAQEWPGCGGDDDAGQAGLKAQVRLDLSTGQLAAVRLEPGRDPDQKTPLQRVGFPRSIAENRRPGLFLRENAGFSAGGRRVLLVAHSIRHERVSNRWPAVRPAGLAGSELERRPAGVEDPAGKRGPLALSPGCTARAGGSGVATSRASPGRRLSEGTHAEQEEPGLVRVDDLRHECRARSDLLEGNRRAVPGTLAN